MLTRRDFGKLALAGLPAATVIRESRVDLWRHSTGEAELADRGRSNRHDHLQLSQPAGSERRGHAQIRRRIGHQCDRADGWTRRELCRRSGSRWRRWWWGRWRQGRRRAGSGSCSGTRCGRLCSSVSVACCWGVGRSACPGACRSRPGRWSWRDDARAARGARGAGQQAEGWRTSVSMDPFKKLRKM